MMAPGSNPAWITPSNASSRGVVTPSSSPQHERPAIAEHDLPRRHPVRPEIDERRHHARRTHDLSNNRLAQPVLQRQHIPIHRQMRQQRPRRTFRMLRLHAQEDVVPYPRDRLRQQRRRTHLQLLHRPGDRQPGTLDRRHMRRIDVDERHVVPGPHQERPHRPPDRPRAPNQDLHRTPSRYSAKYSSTPTRRAVSPDRCASSRNSSIAPRFASSPSACAARPSTASSTSASIHGTA